MKNAFKLLVVLWLAPLATLHAAAFSQLAVARVPFPDALDAAVVSQDRLDDINRRALVLGNGDLSGLLWERNGVLCLRVTKNDVWAEGTVSRVNSEPGTADLPSPAFPSGSSDKTKP
jgi:hypothetical protein